MKNLQRGFIVPVLTLVIALLLVGGGIYVYQSEKDNVEISSNSDSNLRMITSISENSIQIGSSVINIDDFPDDIQVSKEASFGSSERINDAKLSPDGKWVAISVSGFAHDFGWLYNMTTRELKPIAFSYGGGVAIKEWKNNHEVVLVTTSPKPDTIEQVFNVDRLNEYPKVKAVPAEPSITILSPRAGDRIEAGSTVQIKWDAKNLPDKVIIGLHILFNSGGEMQEIVHSGTESQIPNTGSFIWNVPKTNFGDDINNKPIDRNYNVYVTISGAQDSRTKLGRSGNFTIIPAIK